MPARTVILSNCPPIIDGCYEKKGKNRPDGCATFSRLGTFTLRRVQRLDYHDGQENRESDSGHIALLLFLAHAGRLLGVANTHLRWDHPGTPAAEQVGYLQAVELLRVCQSWTPPCDAWLICGDFNRTPDSASADFARE